MIGKSFLSVEQAITSYIDSLYTYVAGMQGELKTLKETDLEKLLTAKQTLASKIKSETQEIRKFQLNTTNFFNSVFGNGELFDKQGL